MRRQKGQSILEFAMIFPFLCFFVFFPFTFMGLWVADWVTLSDVARESARDAAVQLGTEGFPELEAKYAEYARGRLFVTDLTPSDFKIELPDEDDPTRVQTTINATVDKQHSLGGVMKNIFSGADGKSFIDDNKIMDIDVKYSMYKER